MVTILGVGHEMLGTQDFPVEVFLKAVEESAPACGALRKMIGRDWSEIDVHKMFAEHPGWFSNEELTYRVKPKERNKWQIEKISVTGTTPTPAPRNPEPCSQL